MTLFQYLKVDVYNLLSDSFYAYGDNFVLLKYPDCCYRNISTKITTDTHSLSEQLKLPIVIPEKKIALGKQYPNIIVNDRDGNNIYSESIIERPAIFQPINQDGEVIIKHIRGLYLVWKIGKGREFSDILYFERFFTVTEDKVKYDIRERGNGEIIMPNLIRHDTEE